MLSVTKNNSGKKAFTLTEVLFVLVLIIIFISLLSPLIKDVRNKATILACEENLYKIGWGLTLYAKDNGGKFPETLNELVTKGYLADKKTLNCPAAARENSPDYEYISGYSIASPYEKPIVHDKQGNHKGGKNVLYIDGKVSWEQEEISGDVPK